MKLKYLPVLLLLTLPLIVTGQASETTYPGSVIKTGYAVAESYGPYNIGFNFTFYGNTYSQFFVNSSGQVLFGSGSIDGTEVPIPSAALPNNFIAPLWDQLTVSSSGKILYATIGAAPNRKLIIQGTNMGFYPAPIFMGTYLVILYESSNKIQVQYRILVDATDPRAHGASATIGIENSDGTAGIQYAYHNPTAITTGQAISFTPSGPSYSINSNEIYDGVVLTTNITQPEPGIPLLLSPPQDAVIGSDYNFAWSESGNAATYTLLISQFSDMGGATSYPAGTNLSYNVTGLTLAKTYYWGVFATNSTGTTWCEIKKFTTSSNPPLAAVPQTIYVEQTQEKTVKLNYTGGDVSAKTAIITTLPAQGQLYQYNAGIKGALISTIPTTVTDAGMNVIYLANGLTGNSVGNFSYKVHDNSGDTPDALVTVNVSPPGIPNLSNVSKSTTIELQFDRPMADPAGKQGEFTATVNGSSAAISSLSLKTGDNYSIIATLNTPLAGGETVLISYTAGTVASAQGGWLASFTNQPVTLTSQTITFTQSLSKKFSDSPFTFTASAPGGSMTYSSSNLAVTTISGSTATFLSTGSSDITARQAGNGTYAPAKYTRTMTVAKGDQIITFGGLPAKTYGDADFTLSAVAGSSLLVAYVSDNPSVATVTGNTIQIVGAGSAVITASQSGNTNWNAATSVSQTLTVNKADQTIVFSGLPPKTYGDGDFTLSAVAGSSLLVAYASDNPSVATVTGNSVHISGAGTAVITASQAGNTNWNAAASVPQILTVAKASATITFGGLLPTYNGLSQAATAITAPSGLTVGFTYDGSAAIPVNAGSYAVIATINDINYQGTRSGTQVISKAPLTATADDKTRIYGAANSAFTISYSGFVNGENSTVIDIKPIASTTANATTNAGTVPITVSGGSDNNYSFSYVSGTLTITKATATITLGGLSATYNGLSQAATATTTPTGLTVDLTYDGSATIPVNAGSYAVIATINDINYQGTASGTQVIRKANLTFTSDNKTRTYQASNPTLTYTTMGFVNGETKSVLDVLPSIQTTAVQNSPAGNYPITISGGNDNNYTYIYVSGILTITKLQQTITITGIPEKLLVGDTYTLAATSSAGLTVLFESNNTSLATITGDNLTGVSKGLVQIRAYNQGDQNYDAAEVFATVEIYSTHKDIMHLFTPNNDGINDYWELPELAIWGKCDVKVYNRWGKLVFADSNYNNLWDGRSGGNPLPEGAYYFIIKTENAGEVKGTVNIVR